MRALSPKKECHLEIVIRESELMRNHCRTQTRWSPLCQASFLPVLALSRRAASGKGEGACPAERLCPAGWTPLRDGASPPCAETALRRLEGGKWAASVFTGYGAGIYKISSSNLGGSLLKCSCPHSLFLKTPADFLAFKITLCACLEFHGGSKLSAPNIFLYLNLFSLTVWMHVTFLLLEIKPFSEQPLEQTHFLLHRHIFLHSKLCRSFESNHPFL